jgi:hypothetical protein
MGRTEYFGLDGQSILIEIWAAEESATCCGVNLAFAGLGVGRVCFFWGLRFGVVPAGERQMGLRVAEDDSVTGEALGPLRQARGMQLASIRVTASQRKREFGFDRLGVCNWLRSG